MIKVLMIEDDVEFAQLLANFLKRYEIDVRLIDDPFLGLSAGISEYDAVILDLSLPGMDGLEVCKKILRYHKVPIIISSARGSIVDKKEAMQAGAEDYLTKPYDPQEMYLKIATLVKRYKSIEMVPSENELSVEINKETNTLTFNGKELDLTPGEFDIISELYKHKGNIVSREQIMFASSVLKNSNSKALDVMINRLRHKMEDTQKKYIRSIRGEGYKLGI